MCIKQMISVAVLDSAGKLVMEAILETKAETILQFIRSLRGSLHVTFEEGTCAAWLHDLLKPHVTQVLVCDPRKNALLKAGNKNDRVDARKLAELLYLNKLNSVYHGEAGIRTLKELARSYLVITRELTRVRSRLSDLPKLGYSLCRPAGVCTPLPYGGARKDHGSRRAPSRRTLLPAVRHLSCFASANRSYDWQWSGAGHCRRLLSVCAAISRVFRL
jgi:Transposase